MPSYWGNISQIRKMLKEADGYGRTACVDSAAKDACHFPTNSQSDGCILFSLF
jgi:hypothetical protein